MPRTVGALAALLRRCLGDVPPLDGLATWEQALGDPEKLRLFFEVSLPTPPEYREELRQQLEQRVLIPHVLESATRTAAAGRALEGATKVDAILIAPETGFAVLFEAKVLADASSSIGFDVLRNQFARNIDVMLQPNPNLEEPLSQRRPERSCFVLLTPEIFRSHPESRLYGWLMRDYRSSPAALQRDLPHRAGTDLPQLPAGWDGSPGKTATATARRVPMAPRHRQLSAAFARDPGRCRNLAPMREPPTIISTRPAMSPCQHSRSAPDGGEG